MEGHTSEKKSVTSSEYKEMETTKESPWEDKPTRPGQNFNCPIRSEECTTVERNTSLPDSAFWYPIPESNPPKEPASKQDKKSINELFNEAMIEEKKQIEWVKRLGCDIVTHSSSHQRTVLSPEGPSYGFCVVPTLPRPDPPTYVKCKPTSRPNKVYRSEEGKIERVLKLGEHPKEKKFDARKKCQINKLSDTNSRQIPAQEKDVPKPNKMSKSSVENSDKMNKITATKHPPTASLSRRRSKSSSRQIQSSGQNGKCGAGRAGLGVVGLDPGLEESSLNSILAEKIDKLKDELHKSYKENEDQGEKENTAAPSEGPKKHYRSSPKKPRIPTVPASSGDIQSCNSQVKRSRSYDPKAVQEYMKKKRALITDTRQKDHDRKIQEMLEKKNKLKELKAVQLKALKSCAKSKSDCTQARPKWVGLLEHAKGDSESEANRPKSFSSLSKTAMSVAEDLQAGQRIEDARADLLKKKPVEPTQKTIKETEVETVPEPDPFPSCSKNQKPPEENRPVDGEDEKECILRLSDQVKQLTENLQTIKSLKRSGTPPPKTSEAAIQVRTPHGDCCPIHKRQRLSPLVAKKSLGVQVSPTHQVEKVEYGSQTEIPTSDQVHQTFDSHSEESRFEMFKNRLIYFDKLRDEYHRNGGVLFHSQEVPWGVDELKLDFTPSSLESSSKTDVTSNKDKSSTPDHSFKSAVASLALTTDKCLSSGVQQEKGKQQGTNNISASSTSIASATPVINDSEAFIDLEKFKIDKKMATSIFSSASDEMKVSKCESKKNESSRVREKYSKTHSSSQSVVSEISNRQPDLQRPADALRPESGNSGSKILATQSEAILTDSSIKSVPSIKNSGSLSSVSSIKTVPSQESIKESLQPVLSPDLTIKSKTEEMDIKEEVSGTIQTNLGLDKPQNLASSKSDTSISESLSADPLKLPNSIGMLKLFRQVVQADNTLETTSLKYSHSGPALSQYSSQNGQSSTLVSQSKLEIVQTSGLVQSSHSVGDQLPFENCSPPSNNTATLYSLSLRDRFRDEIKRLDTLDVSLNKAINRNNTSSSDIAKMFQSKLDTFSVTKIVAKSTSEIADENSQDSEVSTVSVRKSVTISTPNTSFMDKLQIPDNSRRFGYYESSEGSDISITGITTNMFVELLKDEDLRFKHQTALLKLKAKTLFDKTKAELKLLELQKRKAKEKENEEIAKNIRKKQRGIIIKHQHDLDDIKCLMKAEKLASKERRQLFWHQLQMARLRTVGRKSAKKHNELNKHARPVLMDSSIENGKPRSFSPQKEWSRLYLEKQKRLLDEREAALNARHEAIEGLISWRKILELEEKRVKDLERQAIKLTPHIPCRRIDRGTSPLQVNPEPESLLTPRPKSYTSNSTIPEDLPSQQPSHSEAEEYSSSSKPTDYGSDCSKVSSAVSKHLTSVCFSSNDKGPISGDEKRKHSFIAIKTPLSPRTSRAQRYQSSGSDESILFSQNDTLSEQSDTEVRVCALQQQLRQRKVELERLKREHIKTQRERLRAKEQSLINQIQAYDTYIEQVKSEIKKELDATEVKVMKPQIKQPKLGERRKSDIGMIERRKDESENSSIETEMHKSESCIHLNYFGKENEQQESSEETESIKTLVESSSLLPVEEDTNKISLSHHSSNIDSNNIEVVEQLTNGVDSKYKDFDSEPEGLSEHLNSLEMRENEGGTCKEIEEDPHTKHSSTITVNEFSQNTSNEVSNEVSAATEIATEISEGKDAQNGEEKHDVHSDVELISSSLVKDEAIEDYEKSCSEETNLNHLETTSEIHKEADNGDESNSCSGKIVEVNDISEIAEEVFSTYIEETAIETDHISSEKELTAEKVNLISDEALSIKDNIPNKQEIATKQSFDSTKSSNENINKDEFASTIANEIMLNLLYESFEISEKLWEKNLNKVIEVYKKVTDDTPLLSALQEENRARDSDVRRKACETANAVSEELCKSYVEEATDFMLKTYLRKLGISSPNEDDLKSPDTSLEIVECLGNLDEFDIKVGENEGNWLGEEFTSHSSKEAEELRLQQLQIEQEIEELEQQATQVPYYYVREIPNKPPPPYTPPKKVPTKEEVVSRVNDGISILWSMAEDPGIDLMSVEMPTDYLAQIEDQPYRQFMFDLSKELFLQYKDQSEKEDVVPWRLETRRKLCPPIRTKEDLIKVVERQVKIIFGFEPKAQKENLIIRWAPKKRDLVDELLVRECQEEESEWTDFSVEENIVKNEVADMVIDNVLQVAVEAIAMAFNKKLTPQMS